MERVKPRLDKVESDIKELNGNFKGIDNKLKRHLELSDENIFESFMLMSSFRPLSRNPVIL